MTLVKYDPQFLVYVAGPLGTGPAVWQNVRNAVEMGDRIVRRGMCPIIPHLSVLWAMISPQAVELSHAEWLKLCFAQIRRCDALVWLPGDSPGTAAEVVFARELGKPTSQYLDEIEDMLLAGG